MTDQHCNDQTDPNEAILEQLPELSGTQVQTVADLRRLARAYTGDALRAVLEVMITSNSERLRLAAAEAILDRAWGRPPASPAVHEAPAGQVSDQGDQHRQLIDYLARLAQPAADGRDH